MKVKMDYGYDSLHVSPVDATGRKLTLCDMMRDDTVERLKRVVARRIGKPEAWSQLSLNFEGEELTKDGRYGLPNHHELKLNPVGQEAPSDPTGSRT